MSDVKVNKEEEKGKPQADAPTTEVSLNLNTVNTVLQYLAQKPYQEVAGLIGQIHQEVNPQLPKIVK